MSAVVSGMTSKPSRIYNLAYIFWGYTIASIIISSTQFENVSDYLLLVGVVGGFIATLTFYLKPISLLLWVVLKLYFKFEEIHFSSPFLVETKGKIIAGVYFSLICVIATFFHPSLAPFFEYGNALDLWGQLLIGLTGGIVGVVSCLEATSLPEKIRIVKHYYEDADHGLTVAVGQLRSALERGDWIEARRLYLRARTM